MKSSLHLQDPHHTLGIHSLNDKEKVIRLLSPDTSQLFIDVEGKKVEVKKVCQGDIFEVVVPSSITRNSYKIYHKNGMLAEDPYAFPSTFGEIDSHLFRRGVHYRLYEVLGGRVCRHEGVLGVKFSVWAPSALFVSLVGDFNNWDDRATPMRKVGDSGVFEIFVPGLGSGEKYKFAIVTQEGITKLKSDPLGVYSQLRPNNASIVFDVDGYEWQDAEWMKKREGRDACEKMNVYEVHLASWKGGDPFPNYRELAHELAPYIKEMGFTHIELLPISEHPLDESWGYQVSGFYAATSRYGTPADFQYFVDHMHKNEIGVILDWVPAHFPMDDFSLASFDGTALYEHANPQQGYHPHWKTYIFNYGRYEVSNFLIANALFWMDKMHIDGLRVDAVASMLYLDYGRKEGQWVPNIHGGRENLEALEFLKHLNAIVHEEHPKVIMIAEESTSFKGVTHPLAFEGLGFDLKWNMGWMNDTLYYFKTDPLYRRYEHGCLTFGMLYAFSERFMLVLSHDEVVHGKASLLSKMPGDDWQKFAGLRLLYSYMMCHPGKKLLFMGGEIGQWNEWGCKHSLSWDLLENPPHKGVQNLVKGLNHFYQKNPALWEKDFEPEGFSWVGLSDEKNSIISYLRKGKSQVLLCVHNFTPVYFKEYHIPLANIEEITEVFSSDREEYGGSGKLNASISIQEGLFIQVAPLATMIFEVTFRG
jgi:1,4-alpha-glucan branching enzyme